MTAVGICQMEAGETDKDTKILKTTQTKKASEINQTKGDNPHTKSTRWGLSILQELNEEDWEHEGIISLWQLSQVWLIFEWSTAAPAGIPAFILLSPHHQLITHGSPEVWGESDWKDCNCSEKQLWLQRLQIHSKCIFDFNFLIFTSLYLITFHNTYLSFSLFLI